MLSLTRKRAQELLLGARGMSGVSVAMSPPAFPMARPAEGEPPKEYAELRKHCPVSKSKIWDGSNMWLITKHTDLKKVLVDNRLSKVRTHPGFPELVPGAKAAVEGREPTFVDMDPPQHTKLRDIFEPWFTQEHCEGLRPSIRATVDELLADMEKQGPPANLHEAFSLPLAYRTIYSILGIHQGDYEFLAGNIVMRTSGSSTARDAAAAQEQLTEYMHRLVDEKEKSPGGDLISEVLKRDVKAGRISKEELVAHAFLLLVAGNATVASMVNLGVVELCRHPDQLEAFKSDPEGLVANAVLEICRFHTASALALRRVALENVKVRDQTIKAGEGLIALNMSANRDEEVFEDPDTFDIRRRNADQQVAYGYGTHRCIAEHLSCVELQEAFLGLFRRLPSLQLAEEQLSWSDPKADVGLTQLMVKW